VNQIHVQAPGGEVRSVLGLSRLGSRRDADRIANVDSIEIERPVRPITKSDTDDRMEREKLMAAPPIPMPFAFNGHGSTTLRLNGAHPRLASASSPANPSSLIVAVQPVSDSIFTRFRRARSPRITDIPLSLPLISLCRDEHPPPRYSGNGRCPSTQRRSKSWLRSDLHSVVACE
jgi:hypothetical protein